MVAADDAGDPTQPALGLAFVLLAAPLAAQQWTPAITSGTRVRVGAVERTPMMGTYIGVSADSLRVAIANAAVTVAMPLRSVEWIDESRGRPVARWAILGGIMGMVAGGVIGAAIGEHEDPGGLMSVAGLLLGGLFGAPTGAIVGGLSAREEWTRHVNPDR